MATKYSDKAQDGIQPKGLSVGLTSTTAVYSLASSLSVGDVIQMIKVPKGAELISMTVGFVDAGANIGTVNVGDGVDADRYGTALAYSSTMAQLPIDTSLAPYVYSVDDTIDITVLSVSAASVEGSLVMRAIFSMDS